MTPVRDVQDLFSKPISPALLADSRRCACAYLSKLNTYIYCRACHLRKDDGYLPLLVVLPQCECALQLRRPAGYHHQWYIRTGKYMFTVRKIRVLPRSTRSCHWRTIFVGSSRSFTLLTSSLISYWNDVQAYLVMATGDTTLDTACASRPFEWIRYAQWAINAPLFILLIGDTAQAPMFEIIFAATTALLAVASLFAAALSPVCIASWPCLHSVLCVAS
jgi:hypothetical protein